MVMSVPQGGLRKAAILMVSLEMNDGRERPGPRLWSLIVQYLNSRRI